MGKENLQLIFNFDWRDYDDATCVNDVIRHWLKGNGYEWKYDHYGRLEAFIRGRWVKFEHKNNGDYRGVIYLVK